MLESIKSFFKKNKKREALNANSKETAKERLQLVLMQDRANVSADFLDLMREEIIEVIKKYIDIDEEAMDVRLTNSENEDGTQGAPALYANIPIVNIKDETRKHANDKKEEKEEVKEEKKDDNQKEASDIDITNKEDDDEDQKIINDNEDEMKEAETERKDVNIAEDVNQN